MYKFQLVFRSLLGPMLGPQMAPKSLQNRPQEPSKTVFQPESCRKLFPDPVLVDFWPPGNLKNNVFPFVFQCFWEILLPGSGPQKAPQNTSKMDPKSGPGGLQRVQNKHQKRCLISASFLMPFWPIWEPKMTDLGAKISDFWSQTIDFRLKRSTTSKQTNKRMN